MPSALSVPCQAIRHVAPVATTPGISVTATVRGPCGCAKPRCLRDYHLVDGDSRSNGIADDHEHEEFHGLLFSPTRFNCAECRGSACMLSINGAK